MTCHGEPKEETARKSPFCAFRQEAGKREKGPIPARSKDRKLRGTNGPSDLDGKSSDKLPPVRKDRVEEARKKKQNGDYDNQEVYRKIAERLMDSFGI